jgi:hypothetical protein
MRCRAKKKARPLFDLNWTAAYRFSQLGPGQAAGLGRPGSDLPPWPDFFFLVIHFLVFANPCKFENP